MNQDVIKHLITAIITGIFTLSGSYMAFKSNGDSVDASKLEIAFKRIEVLEVRLDIERKRSFEKDKLLVDRFEAEESYRNSLDRMPFPVWGKVESYENGKITLRNWHVNSAYQDRFKVTDSNYRGKTDFDMWPEKIAQGFYDNDLMVLLRNGSGCEDEVYTKVSQEPISDKNPMYIGRVCKWVDEVRGKRVVFGAIVTEKLLKTN